MRSRQTADALRAHGSSSVPCGSCRPALCRRPILPASSRTAPTVAAADALLSEFARQQQIEAEALRAEQQHLHAQGKPNTCGSS
ncbi:hypothetical protein M8Z33_32415 [Streptomyces sp. ZAF1911]|uniref:hypothetical protein n=1 Tax=Streptomyces sp. ZAF1911 TaxID=2944129 RepID=UPI00237B4EBA|nr:hypothetical protein [Streptomyces sp. ZAF1911]MDD9381274.1 hypothetical protein [Streptomyces sp. ZAF1911]